MSGLERLLARFLYYGTWLASLAIAIGLVFALNRPEFGLNLATTGIGLFILLPVLRVALMLVLFLRGRDYRLTVAAALVLVIILTGIVIGATG